MNTPNSIDTSATIEKPVPESWVNATGKDTAALLPLVTDAEKDYTYQPGWVSYTSTIGGPDIEVICGGLNSKTPDGAALWRQGNLLHFGFQQGPDEMNEAGRNLLVNSIVYISRFTGDRPLIQAPSPFAGASTRSRTGLRGWLDNDDRPVEWVIDSLSQSTLDAIDDRSRDGMKTWWDAHAKYLSPDAEGNLALDAHAVALDLGFDEPSFFTAAIESLRGPAKREHAAGMLARYAPDGPGAEAAADEWAAWYEANQPYLFYSEYGGYRWYVDTLAKQRGVPSAELRGPARADR